MPVGLNLPRMPHTAAVAPQESRVTERLADQRAPIAPAATYMSGNVRIGSTKNFSVMDPRVHIMESTQNNAIAPVTHHRWLPSAISEWPVKGRQLSTHPEDTDSPVEQIEGALIITVFSFSLFAPIPTHTHSQTHAEGEGEADKRERERERGERWRGRQRVREGGLATDETIFYLGP
jgi:hypothetical protein